MNKIKFKIDKWENILLAITHLISDALASKFLNGYFLIRVDIIHSSCALFNNLGNEL